MNDPPYLQDRRTANEPKVHPLIKKSFIFVPSAGMRSAPEILIQEIMLEAFFGIHSEANPKARELDPDESKEGQKCYSERERAILYAIRGRRKMTKKKANQIFFAPAYPQLARHIQFRKNSERVIGKFLFSGPIAQHIWYGNHTNEEKKDLQVELKQLQDDLCEKIRKSLLGNNSCFSQDLVGTDILAATLGPTSFSAIVDTGKDRLETMTMRHDSLLDMKDDELAKRITEDFIAICDLESKLPRMQWIQLLMTFLRFAIPIWLLAQMKITQLVYEWLLKAVDNEDVTSTNEILDSLAKRNRALLHPTLTPTRELFSHIDHYMRNRVELNILLYCIQITSENDFRGKKKINIGGGGKDVLSIDSLITTAVKASPDIRNMERFKQVANGQDIDVRTFLTREAEQFSAWRIPRMGGQGKNIDELFRVLYRAVLGDEDGGHLLTPEGEGANRGFVVFPGQLLLKTMAYLAAQCKSSTQGTKVGMLVLQDVEDHFAQYGIDFSTAADARSRIMDELQDLGLLIGSPDAGSSVAVACPY